MDVTRGAADAEITRCTGGIESGCTESIGTVTRGVPAGAKFATGTYELEDEQPTNVARPMTSDTTSGRTEKYIQTPYA